MMTETLSTHYSAHSKQNISKPELLQRKEEGKTKERKGKGAIQGLSLGTLPFLVFQLAG
jgi:hypothetical protein